MHIGTVGFAHINGMGGAAVGMGPHTNGMGEAAVGIPPHTNRMGGDTVGILPHIIGKREPDHMALNPGFIRAKGAKAAKPVGLGIVVEAAAPTNQAP